MVAGRQPTQPAAIAAAVASYREGDATWRGPADPPRIRQLADHFTPLGGRLGLVAQTVETVRFARPERVDFRLVRGPVPHVVEAFVLTEQPAGGTLLAYEGEIGADLWAV